MCGCLYQKLLGAEGKVDIQWHYEHLDSALSLYIYKDVMTWQIKLIQFSLLSNVSRVQLLSPAQLLHNVNLKGLSFHPGN